MTVKRFKLASLGAVLMLHAQVFAQEADLPSDDFLEYLAALVDQDGEWVDPLELEQLPDEFDPDAETEPLETDAQELP